MREACTVVNVNGSCLQPLSSGRAGGPPLASLAELPSSLLLPHEAEEVSGSLPVRHLFAQLESIGPWAEGLAPLLIAN